ncbi:MAG: hypothetical protein WD749_03070 [Phycisphaerales bacterium]
MALTESPSNDISESTMPRAGRWAIALVALLVWGSHAWAVQVAQSQEPPEPTEPCIKVVSESPEQCGAARVGTLVARSFTLLNATGGRVSLSVARKSCGCVATEFKQGELGPEESTELTLSTTAAALGGEQIHFAEIVVTRIGSDAAKSLCRFPLGFRYTPDLEFMLFPDRHILIHCTAAEPRDFFVYVNGPAIRDRPPTGLRATSNDIEAAGVENTENPNVVRLHFRARPASAGVRQSRVEFDVASATRPRVSLAVTMIVRPPLEAAPPGIIASGTNPATRFTLTLRHRPGMPDAPKPARVTVDSNWISARLAPAGEGTTELQLLVSVDALKAPASGGAYINIEDEAGRQLAVVPLAWIPTPPGQPVSAK